MKTESRFRGFYQIIEIKVRCEIFGAVAALLIRVSVEDTNKLIEGFFCSVLFSYTVK